MGGIGVVGGTARAWRAILQKGAIATRVDSSLDPQSLW